MILTINLRTKSDNVQDLERWFELINLILSKKNQFKDDGLMINLYVLKRTIKLI